MTDWSRSVEAICSSLASNSAHSKKRGEASRQMRSSQQIPGDHWSAFDTPFIFSIAFAAMVKES